MKTFRERYLTEDATQGGFLKGLKDFYAKMTEPTDFKNDPAYFDTVPAGSMPYRHPGDVHSISEVPIDDNNTDVDKLIQIQ